jgi:hypothetical protein
MSSLVASYSASSIFLSDIILIASSFLDIFSPLHKKELFNAS